MREYFIQGISCGINCKFFPQYLKKIKGKIFLYNVDVFVCKKERIACVIESICM
jgi:hypothetical protein